MTTTSISQWVELFFGIDFKVFCTLVLYCCVNPVPLRVQRPSQNHSTLKAKHVVETTIVLFIFSYNQ